MKKAFDKRTLLDFEEVKRRALQHQKSSTTLNSQNTMTTSTQFETSTGTSSLTTPDCTCGGTGTVNVFGWIHPENGIPYETVKMAPCVCQAAEKAARYNPRASMSAEERGRSFSTAVVDAENKMAFSQCYKFAESIKGHIEAGRWLYISGDDKRAKEQGLSAFGTGKTYVTHCIANMLADMGVPALFVTEAHLYAEIKASYNRGSNFDEADVLEKYERAPVLLIDDMFKTKITDWSEDKLFHLLDKRDCKGRVTIINSNYNPNRISEMLPKNGGAVESRIVGRSIRIEMIGRDRRRP